jgi:hypothetical protein
MKKQLIIVLIFAAVGFGGYLLITCDCVAGEYNDSQILPGEYDTFAQCLYDNGMRMYGSETCSQCARQRRAFGDSAHLLQEIECDPRNSEYVEGQCLDDITHTPTWIQQDKTGKEIYRFKSGYVDLESLAEQSGCPLIKDEEPTKLPE